MYTRLTMGSHGSQEGRQRLSSDDEVEKGSEEEAPNAEPIHDAYDAEPQEQLVNEEAAELLNEACPV